MKFKQIAKLDQTDSDKIIGKVWDSFDGIVSGVTLAGKPIYFTDKNYFIPYTKELEALDRIKVEVLGTKFNIAIEVDKKYGQRKYLQVNYEAKCTKTRKKQLFKGRKWYLSSYMTLDEIIKTAYAAIETAVKHEIMEGFKVDGKPLFNPHTSFEALLSVSDNEVTRP